MNVLKVVQQALWLINRFKFLNMLRRNAMEQRNAEIKKERTFNTSFYGIVINKSNNRGATDIRLDNKKVYYIISIDNLSLKPSDFHNFIQLNDSISHESKDDTIYIFRNNERYCFLLD